MNDDDKNIIPFTVRDKRARLPEPEPEPEPEPSSGAALIRSLEESGAYEPEPEPDTRLLDQGEVEDFADRLNDALGVDPDLELNPNAIVGYDVCLLILAHQENVFNNHPVMQSNPVAVAAYNTMRDALLAHRQRHIESDGAPLHTHDNDDGRKALFDSLVDALVAAYKVILRGDELPDWCLMMATQIHELARTQAHARAAREQGVIVPPSQTARHVLVASSAAGLGVSTEELEAFLEDGDRHEAAREAAAREATSAPWSESD